MMTLLDIGLVTWLKGADWPALGWALLVAVVGLILSRVLPAIVLRLVRRSLDAQRAMLLRRAISYTVVALAFIGVLHELGTDLTVLAGAAGVLTVAIGFASQTSASQLISGLFVIAEGSFAVGDTIKVGEHVGEVLAVDWLSVKIRTFDNLMVRVPNESLIKTAVVNFSRYAIRRVDVFTKVAISEDLEKARRILLAVADEEPGVLREPEPVVILTSFTENSAELRLSSWVRRERYAGLLGKLSLAAHTRLREGQIAAPTQRFVRVSTGEEA